MPSPSGEIAFGLAATVFSANATARAPTVPLAARTPSPASIVHEYEPCGAADASHVQSTDWPDPLPLPATAPSESTTVTFHGKAWERRARKRTNPPTAPVTEGEYSFGNPCCPACRAIAPSCE